MNTYGEIMAHLMRQRALPERFELREIARWTVHCAECGTQIVKDTPQTDKAFEALKASLADRPCPNRRCVTRGGTERRTQQPTQQPTREARP